MGGRGEGENEEEEEKKEDEEEGGGGGEDGKDATERINTITKISKRIVIAQGHARGT